MDDDDFVARLIETGTPEPYARLFLGSFQAARHVSSTSPTRPSSG
jgi:hypothetical protein